MNVSWSVIRDEKIFASSKFLDPYLLCVCVRVCDFFVTNAFINSIESFICLCFQPWFKNQHGSALLCTFICIYISHCNPIFLFVFSICCSFPHSFAFITRPQWFIRKMYAIVKIKLRCALKCKFTSLLLCRICIWLS